MRSSAEVKTELKTLRGIKSRVPRYGPDPDKVNYWDMLHAQVQTLRYGLTMADIRKQYPDGGEVQGAAEDALYWIGGGAVLSPSESWATVARPVFESA